jgi:hypothetical protein
MKRATSLLTAGLSISGTFAQVKVPSNFEPEVKWQIVIQNTIDFTAPVQPADAVVWDLDLYHIARTPEIVGHLRVRHDLLLYIPPDGKMLTGAGKQP